MTSGPGFNDAMKLLAPVSLFAAIALAQQSPLVHKQAPELSGKQWINTSEGANAKTVIADRKGKVTVVHFWTFACINCKRNLPSYDRWHEKFSPQGVEIIGVHTPELDIEKDFRNVESQVRKLGIEYPVLFDPDYRNWNRWRQQYWPTAYVIDKSGVIRAAWVGELNHGGQQGEAKMAAVIEKLLAE